jgi:hypothetical protein
MAVRRKWKCKCEVLACLLMLALFGHSGAFAQTVSPCSEVLPEAEQRYVEGEIDTVITLLAPCVASEEISVEEAVGAYRLLSLSYVKRGELEEAKVAVLELLNRKPDYEPDPVRDLPSYAALVNVVKQQLTLAAAQAPVEETEEPRTPVVEPVRRRSWFAAHRGWVLAGGSVAVASIVAAVAAGGGGGGGGTNPPPGGSTNPLPPPPRLPVN